MFYTSLTVINELLYVATREYYRSLGVVKGSYSLRKAITTKGYPKPIIDGICKLLEDLEVEVLVEDVGFREVIDVATRFKMLPSDAVIALTCKRYGIETILTFDEEFRRIPWLRVVP